MTALLLFAMMQAPPDATLADRIEAFVKGDEGARKELLALGAYAIRPLQQARDKAPGKIDPLVLELKRAAAYPKGSRVPDKFAQVASLSLRDLEIGPESVRILQTAGAHVFLDRFDASDLKSKKFSFVDVKSPLDAVDQVCRQTGLDYGFFHNAIVIAKPERLWPPGPPAKPPELQGEALARAKALVEELDDESIEARESATAELFKIGPPVLAVLESNLKRSEAELVARCTALIDRLRTPARGAFGPAAAQKGKLTPEGEKVLNQFEKMKVSFDFQITPFADMVSYVNEFTGIAFEIQGGSGGPPVTIRASDQTLMDLLSLITQSRDLDFVIRGAKVVIDSREAIRKTLNSTK